MLNILLNKGKETFTACSSSAGFICVGGRCVKNHDFCKIQVRKFGWDWEKKERRCSKKVLVTCRAFWCKSGVRFWILFKLLAQNMIFQYDKCQKGECVSWKNKLMYDDYWGEDPDSIGNSRKFWKF